jgi:hypothetical protein
MQGLSVFVHFVVCCTCTRNFGVPCAALFIGLLFLSLPFLQADNTQTSPCLLFTSRLTVLTALTAAHGVVTCYEQTVPIVSETVTRRYLISNFVLVAYRVLCVMICVSGVQSVVCDDFVGIH